MQTHIINQFNFPSFGRKDICYKFDRSTDGNDFYKCPSAYVSAALFEFLTYGDRNTQHSYANLVHVDNVTDCLLSLCFFIDKHKEYIPTIDTIWPHLSENARKEQLAFLKHLFMMKIRLFITKKES